MEKCDTCSTRYVCEGEHEFDCKRGQYIHYTKDNEKCNKSKTRYNEEEQKAFLHGYLYGKAEEMKAQGLFKDLSTKEIVKLMCSEVINEI